MLCCSSSDVSSKGKEMRRGKRKEGRGKGKGRRRSKVFEMLFSSR